MTLHQEELNAPRMKDVLRKIKALRAKAEDSGTTEQESLSFAAKVAEMMAEYNLAEAQLDIKEQEIGEIGHEDYAANWNNSPARRVLAIAVCKLFGVKPLIRRGKKDAWTLIGRKHNIIQVQEMTAYLIQTTVRLSNQWKKTSTFGNHIDFRRGCFQRLAERIMDLYWKQAREQAKWTPTGNPGNLPALYQNEDKLMDGYAKARWNPRPMRAQRIKHGMDAHAGRKAAETISLNQQVSDTTTKRLK